MRLDTAQGTEAAGRRPPRPQEFGSDAELIAAGLIDLAEVAAGCGWKESFGKILVGRLPALGVPTRPVKVRRAGRRRLVYVAPRGELPDDWQEQLPRWCRRAVGSEGPVFSEYPDLAAAEADGWRTFRSLAVELGFLPSADGSVRERIAFSEYGAIGRVRLQKYCRFARPRIVALVQMARLPEDWRTRFASAGSSRRNSPTGDDATDRGADELLLGVSGPIPWPAERNALAARMRLHLCSPDSPLEKRPEKRELERVIGAAVRLPSLDGVERSWAVVLEARLPALKVGPRRWDAARWRLEVDAGGEMCLRRPDGQDRPGLRAQQAIEWLAADVAAVRVRRELWWMFQDRAQGGHWTPSAQGCLVSPVAATAASNLADPLDEDDTESLSEDAA